MEERTEGEGIWKIGEEVKIYRELKNIWKNEDGQKNEKEGK